MLEKWIQLLKKIHSNVTFINPRPACAVRVMVVVLCVCLSVCLVCLSKEIHQALFLPREGVWLVILRLVVYMSHYVIGILSHYESPFWL